MIGRIVSLAASGVVQLIRSRVYLNILVAGGALVVAALVLDRMSGNVTGRVLASGGLAFLSLIVAVLAGVTGVSLITREIETKQIHVVVARPVWRSEVVLGRFATVAALVVITNLLLGGLLTGLALVLDVDAAWRIFAAAQMASMEGFLVAGLAVAFGTGSSSTVSALFTSTVFVLGRLSPMLWHLLEQGKIRGPMEPVLRGVYAVLPHLDRFDLTSWVISGGDLDVQTWLLSMVYGLLYIAGLLGIAAWRIERRDLL